MPGAQLTAETFRKGFLIDEELMAGVSENPDKPGEFMAFLVENATGEVVSVAKHESLESALEAVNSLPRDWAFESPSGGCGSGQCSGGGCSGGGCGGGDCQS